MIIHAFETVQCCHLLVLRYFGNEKWNTSQLDRIHVQWKLMVALVGTWACFNWIMKYIRLLAFLITFLTCSFHLRLLLIGGINSKKCIVGDSTICFWSSFIITLVMVILLYKKVIYIKDGISFERHKIQLLSKSMPQSCFRKQWIV